MVRWSIKWIILTLAVLLLAGSQAKASNLDNFVIKNFKVDMELGKNTECHSTLLTTETIVADFPPNQNKGILRTFVRRYDGHTANLEVISVTDEFGNALEYN